MSPQAVSSENKRLLSAWLMAILRFANSREDADLATVMALAFEIDRQGNSNIRASFHYFRRSAAEVCAALQGRSSPNRAVVQRYLSAISSPGLKLALTTAIEDATRASIGPPAASRGSLVRRLAISCITTIQTDLTITRRVTRIIADAFKDRMHADIDCIVSCRRQAYLQAVDRL